MATSMTPQVQQMANLAATLQFGGLPMSLMPMGIQKQEDSCIVTTGNTADTDKDGIPSNVTYTYNCTFGSNEVKGTAVLKDKNDADAKSGATYTIDMNLKMSASDQQGNFTLTQAIKGSMDYTPKANGGIKFEYRTSNKISATGTHNNQTVNYTGEYSYNLNSETTPDATGVKLVFSGDASGSSNQQGHSFSGSTTFSGDVHYSNGHNGCYGIDSGSITFKSGNNTYTLNYTGCNITQ
ncbi:hypothetical protein [Deinococcus cellulosilyticus]|nr:hypothetical protein [Deinococcus cellulosilyticus]